MQNSKNKQSTIKRQSNKKIQTQLIQLLVLSSRELKLTMINVLERMVGNVNNRYEQMGNFSRKMKTVRVKWKYQK